MESLERIIECINSNRSFMLEAGAGSGKTWTLIEVLRYIISTQGAALMKADKKIACITYTNVAKNEIEERIEFNPLVQVGTIHEFLWEVVQPYQRELKISLLEMNERSRRKEDDLVTKLEQVTIEYVQFGVKYSEGRISHNEVLELASSIFQRFPKIAVLAASKYPFVFVDEYQDTEEKVVNLLVDNWLGRNRSKVVLGFFGDSMQKIYNTGIGYFERDGVEMITKSENFRCSKRVIHVLNRIRTNIQQIPTGNNQEGEVTFFHTENLEEGKDAYEIVLRSLKSTGWNFDPERTKILMLTHRGIAQQLYYPNLLQAYTEYGMNGRDRLYQKEDPHSDLLLNKVERLASLYEEKRYGEFVDLLAFDGLKLRKHKDKTTIKTLMDGLKDVRNTGTIEMVLRYVFDNRLLGKPKKIREIEIAASEPQEDESFARKITLHNTLMPISYREVMQLDKYIENYTPFSTKHGVKGAEFDDIFVVIDDTAWSQYNFSHVFEGNTSNPGRFERTRNLLYVCCSRSKNRLAVLSLSKVGGKAMTTIHDWFEKQNVVDVSSLRA